MFRRSGVVPQLEGDEKRIFDAVVKPDARAGERQRRRGARAAAQGDRARRGDARERALRRERAGRGRRRRAREARALPARARCDRRLTPSDGRGRRSRLAWLESLSPWPDGFGLERMRALLAALGDPQRAFDADPRRRHERQVDDARAPRSRARSAAPAVHLAARLAAGPSGSTPTPDGLRARARSASAPHASSRRDAVRGADRRGVRRVRRARRRRRRRRGRPRRAARRDERARRAASSLLTNVALEHTDVLGDDARGDRGREARGRAARRASSSSPDERVRATSSRGRRPTDRLALAARPPRRSSATRRPTGRGRRLPGPARAPRERRSRSGTARTTRRRRLAARAAAGAARYVVVASILGDKDVDGDARPARSRAGDDARRDQLGERARAAGRGSSPTWRAPHFAARRGRRRPGRRARPRARPRGPTARARHRLALPPCRLSPRRRRNRTMTRARERLSVFVFAVLLLALFVGLAFAAGLELGRMLL